MDIKTYVYELSDQAIFLLKKECYDILMSYDHEINHINDFIENLEKEKLIDLEEFISYQRMLELSVIE